jgi:dolichol-phosphate mannosyltransferase
LRAAHRVDLTDPMSGYFLLRTATARELAPRLSAIGFKILLDLLATSERSLTVKDFPMNFSARRSGESKLDRAIAFDFLAGLYDKSFGRLIPTRFADVRHRRRGGACWSIWRCSICSC